MWEPPYLEQGPRPYCQSAHWQVACLKQEHPVRGSRTEGGGSSRLAAAPDIGYLHECLGLQTAAA